MPTQVFTLYDEADTARLGVALAKALPPGAVVSLTGTLGAGKTRLVQAVAQAVGVKREEVTSPTFVLVNEYTSGVTPVYHFDAYRLSDDDEFLQLGPEEYFGGLAAAGPGLCFIEWGDRVARCLPQQRIDIELAVEGQTQRRVTCTDAAGVLRGPLTLASAPPNSPGA
ncbi:MAG: tRNA (adenosine(37)-N6)-threonylcarbamoyltransferase complex ATPase subunit type 1 TsaE [Planctomycetota bacterium]